MSVMLQPMAAMSVEKTLEHVKIHKDLTNANATLASSTTEPHAKVSIF